MEFSRPWKSFRMPYGLGVACSLGSFPNPPGFVHFLHIREPLKRDDVCINYRTGFVLLKLKRANVRSERGFFIAVDGSEIPRPTTVWM